MRFSHLKLANWKNFKSADVALRSRMFLVGPNATGKSNFLDVFRFLRDVADPRGGLQAALQMRRGLGHLRSLHAGQYSNVLVDVEVTNDRSVWRYVLELHQDKQRIARVAAERVEKDGDLVVERPSQADLKDPARLTQTHLEQVSANEKFRDLARFFADVRYLHAVPQLIREPERSVMRKNDPFGSDLLEQIGAVPEKTRQSRLRKIEQALTVAAPQLEHLKWERDDRGVAHLLGRYRHWRPKGGWQREDEFSDGTLRLLGLLWSMLDGNAPLLLEEPELSLNPGVVRHLAPLMARLVSRTGRQIIVSTHSAELLSDPGIPAESIVLMTPTEKGTRAELAAERSEIRRALEAGLSAGDVVLARTAPVRPEQLDLFDG